MAIFYISTDSLRCAIWTIPRKDKKKFNRNIFFWRWWRCQFSIEMKCFKSDGAQFVRLKSLKMQIVSVRWIYIMKFCIRIIVVWLSKKRLHKIKRLKAHKNALNNVASIQRIAWTPLFLLPKKREISIKCKRNAQTNVMIHEYIKRFFFYQKINKRLCVQANAP